MSRVPKWKFEKAKVKVVFRLQFHATQIPQPGWEKLFVSFIPADTGKVTAKTTKANVRNGSCKWSDPIYETTKLLQDARTKKYDEKHYKLVVAMGSSRSSLLGDVSINLADYSDALKPLSVALPLNRCDFGTVLHITVQLLTSKTGFREFEQQRELSEKAFTSHDSASLIAVSSLPSSEQTDKASARVRYRPGSTELLSVEEAGESNESYEDSGTGIDGSSYTSESIHAEKNDSSCTHDIDSLKSITYDLGGPPPGQSRRPEKELQNDSNVWPQGNNDWIHRWNSDCSMDNDLAGASEECNRLRVRLEAAESVISQLKLEASTLQSLTDEFGVETQRLAEELATELASGQEMAREFSKLKSEALKLKSEINELKLANAMHIPGRISAPSTNLQNDSPSNEIRTTLENQHLISHDFRIEWLQGLLLIEGQVREIQSKACLGYHENSLDFLHSDFEVLESLLKNVKQGIMGSIPGLVEGTHRKGVQMFSASQSKYFVQDQMLEESCGGLHHPNDMLPFASPLHRTDPVTSSMMEEKMCKLMGELDKSESERENLAKKMNQMECYYEALIREMEVNQKHTLDELESLKTEHAACIFRIPALQSQIEKLHQDVNEQFIRFAEERHNLDTSNKELRQRAVVSETALKKVRRNYSVAVDRLQKDLELLSLQVLSMYETNENLAKQALTDASDILFHCYTNEQSEEAHQFFEYKDHYRLNCTGRQSEAALVKSQTVLSPMLNTEQNKLVSKPDLNFEFIDERNGMFQRDGSTNINLWTGNEHLNGLVTDNTKEFASQQNNILQKCSIVPGSLSLASLSNEEPVHRLISTVPPVNPWGSGKLEPMKTQNQCTQPESQLRIENIFIGDTVLSSHMLKDLHCKTEAEVSELHLLDLQNKIFSHILVETLNDSHDAFMHMKYNFGELEHRIEHFNEMEKSFIFKLQSVSDETRILRENENKYISALHDLTSKSHNLEGKLQDALEENDFLVHKAAENERLLKEYRVYESKYKALSEERKELELLLKRESEEKVCLQAEFDSITANLKSLRRDFNEQSLVNDKLQKTIECIQDNLENLCSTLVSFDDQVNDSVVNAISLNQKLNSEHYDGIFSHLKKVQQEAYKRISRLCQEKKETEEQRDLYQYSLKDAEFQLLHMKQKSESDLEEMTKKLDLSNTIIEKLKLELHDIANKLKFSLEAEEKYTLMNQELSSKIINLEKELQNASNENRTLVEQLQEFASVCDELEKTKLSIANCSQENKMLMLSVQTGKEASIQMKTDFDNLQESLRWAQEELQSERGHKVELEALILDLRLQQKEKSQQLSSLDEQRVDSANLKQRMLELEQENFALQQNLMQSEESQRKRDAQALSLRLQVDDLESCLVQYSLTADIEGAYLRSQFESMMQILLDKLSMSEKDLQDIHMKYQDVANSIQKCMANETQLVAENERLAKALESLKSEFDISNSERDEHMDHINTRSFMWKKAENLKAMAGTLDADNANENLRYEDEIQRLKSTLHSYEEEVDFLRSSRDEFEITDILLRSKLYEQHAEISMIGQWDVELRKLREQNNELVYKLSEQILKTEEFKNLSIHLRELKDKADVEGNQARERRETDGSLHANQESLRIAFIREQCETKLQELRNQLYGSKKHAEEMLYKLQDAIDEVERAKKREISLVKKNDELSLKVSELEAEVESLLTDRRELVKAFDKIKAELDCTVLSLNCCREENLTIEASLHECNEERTKTRIELDLVKRLLENRSTTADVTSQMHDECSIPSATSIGKILEDGNSGLSVFREALNLSVTPDEEDKINMAVVPVGTAERTQTSNGSISCKQEEDLCHSNGNSHLIVQNSLVSKSRSEKETLLESNAKQIAEMKEHLKEQQRLKTEMDLLHKELERLKDENMACLLPLEEHNLDQALQGLERELSQLESANENLGSIYPLFKEFPGTGNALERVLALELELAESLQAKKNPEARFQSSFLKQHGDEEAVFQSFRDINELIRDMLDLKKRNAVVETDLKEMHSRYSQLSLQFAEVEGERQRLLMTLKNRTPRKS